MLSSLTDAGTDLALLCIGRFQPSADRSNRRSQASQRSRLGQSYVTSSGKTSIITFSSAVTLPLDYLQKYV
jgi:hypothetical protein